MDASNAVSYFRNISQQDIRSVFSKLDARVVAAVACVLVLVSTIGYLRCKLEETRQEFKDKFKAKLNEKLTEEILQECISEVQDLTQDLDNGAAQRIIRTKIEGFTQSDKMSHFIESNEQEITTAVLQEKGSYWFELFKNKI